MHPKVVRMISGRRQEGVLKVTLDHIFFAPLLGEAVTKVSL